MCEIPLLAADRGTGRARKRRFDPIEVREDGAPRGRREQFPWVLWVCIPGVPADELRELKRPQSEDDAGQPYFEGLPAAEPAPGVYRYRRWGLDVESLPRPQRRELVEDGEIVLTRQQARRAFRRKRDNRRFEEQS